MRYCDCLLHHHLGQGNTQHLLVGIQAPRSGHRQIPNFRKLVCIFGGLMPQTRRRRWIRSSGDSTWPAQEQMTGGSSSHAAAPQAPTCVNWDDDMDDFMPPKSWPPTHDVPPTVHEPRSRKERKGKGRGSSSHAAAPQVPTCVPWSWRLTRSNAVGTGNSWRCPNCLLTLLGQYASTAMS